MEQKTQQVVEEVKAVLDEKPVEVAPTALSKLKIIHPGEFSANIQRQIETDIAKRDQEKGLRKQTPEKAIKQAKKYIDRQIVSHLKLIDNLLLGDSPDKDHLIVLNFAHIQQKMGDYLAGHFFKHGIVSALPELIRYFIHTYHQHVHNRIGAHLQGNTPEMHAKWFISHGLCVDFFSRQTDMKIIRIDRASIEALDVQQGVDFIVIDKSAYRRWGIYVPVYLVDSKSYAAIYGEDMRMYSIDWDTHKSLRSALYEKVIDEVGKKVWKNKKFTVMPIKTYINTAYDQFLQDHSKLDENAQILRRNFKQKFWYLRELVYKHIGYDNKMPMPKYRPTDVVAFSSTPTKR